MRMHKKSEIFIPLISVAAIGALIFFVIRFTASAGLAEDSPLGAYASALYDVQAESEKALLYIDESAKLAFDETVLQLGKNGGMQLTEAQNSAKCGSYIYSLWNSPSDVCFPDAYDQTFKDAFNVNFRKHLALYPTALFAISYEYTFSSSDGKTTLSGKTNSDITFPIVFGMSDQEKASQQAINQNQGADSCGVAKEPIDISSVQCSAPFCYLNPEANAKLKEISQKLAQKGYRLEVREAYRTLEYQQQLWDACTEKKEESVCRTEVCKPGCTCPHITGGAIDITLYDANNAPVNDANIVVPLMCDKENGVLTGWVNYAPEGWHFEYGTERWKRAKAQDSCSLV